mgnify:CR=1 FL=1
MLHEEVRRTGPGFDRRARKPGSREAGPWEACGRAGQQPSSLGQDHEDVIEAACGWGEVHTHPLQFRV